MISVNIKICQGTISSISVSGHSGYADAGEDIVCAAVSSAVQLTANLLTEYIRIPAKIKIDDNKITIDGEKLDESQLKTFSVIVSALADHLEAVKEEFPDNISIKFSEV